MRPHRVLDGPVEFVVVAGDSRTTNGPWRVEPSEILGRQWLHVPLYRRITDVIPGQLLFASLAGVAAVLLLWPTKLEDDDADTDPADVLAATPCSRKV